MVRLTGTRALVKVYKMCYHKKLRDWGVLGGWQELLRRREARPAWAVIAPSRNMIRVPHIYSSTTQPTWLG